ncbi:unnamed protein product [Linum trigynum]|uniref:CCHC-type domain-containing protein n=1 Tax=Linum trigynum TaxID=586398 RepID=A0AAV2EUQ6_9ROSI
MPPPPKLGDDHSFNTRYGSLQFLATHIFLLGAETPLAFQVARGGLTAVRDKLEMMRTTPAERESMVIPKEFERVLNPKKVMFKGCRKGKAKKQQKKKKRKCGRCGRRDGHYIKTCPEPEGYVPPARESSSDEEDDDDDLDADNDGGDEGGDDGDDDDDQSGRPQKTGPRTRSSTMTHQQQGKSNKHTEPSVEPSAQCSERQSERTQQRRGHGKKLNNTDRARS